MVKIKVEYNHPIIIGQMDWGIPISIECEFEHGNVFRSIDEVIGAIKRHLSQTYPVHKSPEPSTNPDSGL